MISSNKKPKKNVEIPSAVPRHPDLQATPWTPWNPRRPQRPPAELGIENVMGMFGGKIMEILGGNI